MEQLQVLVATMNRRDFSLAERMNLVCDAVIANQADREEITTRVLGTARQKMITTPTRGVGLNRNIALMAAEAEIVLFADDDVTYNDGMAQAVVEAFRDNPRADVMVFSMDIEKNGVITERRHLKPRRLRAWNAMRFGTYTVAARRGALVKRNITFHQSFGGGCPFSAGEDTLFLKACFDRGLRVYASDYVLGKCRKDSSSWFVGYNEKYFYDKGVLVRNLFPRLYPVMGLYFALRFKRETEVGALRRVGLMYQGIRAGRAMIPYQDKT